MAAILKKQILKKLARFTKTLTPDDIDLNLSKGIGVLKNLELDAVYISDITNLPPWLEISSIVCDNIKVEVHITKIQTKPIHIVIDSIDVKISVIDEMKLRQKQEIPSRKQSTGSKYGLTEKVLDSMFIEIESINIEFTSTQFRAELEVSSITLKCTDHEFKSCLDNLVKSRPVNNADQSVTVFRQLSFMCIKATARSSLLTKSNTQLIRLNCDSSFVNFSMKKKLADCSHMCSKFIIQLGVLSFILNDSELKEASYFLQHLQQLHELAKVMEQELAARNPPVPPSPSRQRDSEARSAQALNKLRRRQTSEVSPQTQNVASRKSSAGASRNFLQKDEEGKVDISASMMHLQSTFIHEDENIESYQLGKKRIPPGLIVQTSIHFRVQKLDVHLCCQIAGSSGEGLHKLESTHIQFSGIGLDIYPDQKAGSQRHHWANFDYKFQDRTEWGMGLLKDTEKKASRVQTGSHLLFRGVSLHKLRESVICFRCVDFSISPVATGDSSDKQRPFIASDKGSYKFGQDAPTIWIDFTAYFYPTIASESYMIPRPNLYVCINPVQVTFYQDTFLWFIKFVIKMALTLKMGEQEGKQSQKKQKIGELTLIGKNQLKGMDIHVGTLMTKVTIPLAYPPESKVTPDRPVAVQLDISEVIVRNHTAVDMVHSCGDLVRFLQRLHSSWLLRSHNEYPHTPDDLPLKPTILRDLFTLLHQKESKARSSFGDIEKMKKTQLWHIELRHFSLSLVSSLTEEGVMRPDEFMEPITINAWIATNIISHLKPLAELAKHLSDQQSEALNDNPLIYYMVSLPSVVDVNLRQVVFLSLMRLKDTITALKGDVLSEVRKMDRVPEGAAEEDPSPLLKISGVVGVDRICVSLPLPLDLHKSVGTQCDTEIPDPAVSEMYRTRMNSHSSLYNHEEPQGALGRPRSVLHSLDEDSHSEDNQSALTSSLSSEGSDVMHSDLISLTSSQMNVYDRDAVTMDQLYFAEPDFHQQSFFSSFSQQIGAITEQLGRRGHSQVSQPLKQKILSVVDLLSAVTVGNSGDIIKEGRVLLRDDVLTYVFRVYVKNVLLFPEIVGEKLRIKGAITKLSFAEEPIEVTEYIDHCNAPRKHAKHVKNFQSADPRDSPIIKFIAELGNHVEEKYSMYSPAPSLSVDARVSGLSGAIYSAHIKDIKEVIKDDVTPSPTTVPISLTLQDLNITLAELPGSPDTDIIIGIETLQLVREPDYKLNIIEPKQLQSPQEHVLRIQLRERVFSEELRDDETPLPQDEDTAANTLDNSIVSSQSDFTEIDALPEYTQALLEELTETKQKYEITLATNHSLNMELEDFRSKICSTKEVFTKTFSDVQNLATKNSSLIKQVCSLEDRNRDLENDITDIKIAKRSVETLLKSKVNNLEDAKRSTSSFQNEIGSLKDKIDSLLLNKQSLMEILERNSEEIRLLTLRNDELESTPDS